MNGATPRKEPEARAREASPPNGLERLAEAVVLADDAARVTYLNPAAEQLLGVTTKQACGRALDKVLALRDGESGQSVSVCEPASAVAPFNGLFPLLACRDGEGMPVQFSIARSAAPGLNQGYIVSLRDASVLQRYIDKLATQAMHDEHSRLLRRAELVKRLWRVLQETDSGHSHAFMYLDLDNFKAVNDQAGHAAGDLAIQQIASRFKEVVRGRDTLARLGGDEFGLLLERCPVEHARERARQLLRAVESYALRWEGETYRVGLSIGLAIFNTRNQSLNAVLAAADAACYQAKRDAGNSVHIKEVALG